MPGGGRLGGMPQTPSAAAPKPGPKPYDQVITKDAKSDPGIFTVHRIDDKIYFEIPAAQMGKEMLFNAELAGTNSGGFNGTAALHRVVRFTRRNNTIFLRSPNYNNRAENGVAIERAVANSNIEPILAAFNVEAEGKDNSVVIDVTRLFTSNPSEFSVSGAVGGAGVDPTRSYVDRAKSFPTNIEITSNLTFTGVSPRGDLGAILRSLSSGGPTGVATVLVHYSLVLLPEKPMTPRYYDSRVGYFTEDYDVYGAPENKVITRDVIARYRLEKKDPNAAVSEPVKPIVYYISREVPEWLHPYLKHAVEDWNPAFEQAGFKNAIVCKDAPTLEEDPNWDPEDVRYSVIRWAPTTTENAQGPHVSDPRTGEILSAHIIVWHNVMKLAQTWYFTQVADLDPKAKKLPLPQDLVGRLMQYVVCHEVGHTLGLRHNHKASSSYTIAQLRDRNFTEKFGDEASIMDYGRFNYVAQPGDNANLIPILGPYDKFAIEWGYKPLGFSKPEDEKGDLDKIAARQVNDATLRFGGEDAAAQADPTVQMEDLGNDPIEATRLGLLNINRIAKMLIPATTTFGGEYDDLAETYADLWGQRSREFGHVAKLVGGVVETRYHAGRGGVTFVPVPAARQAAAVKFLIDNAFATPRAMLSTEILYRIGPSGAQDRTLNSQAVVLNQLMGTAQLARLQDAAATMPGNSYTIARLVHDVQAGIFTELSTPNTKIDPYRRNLQRFYVEFLGARSVTPEGSTATNDMRGVALANLRQLQSTVNTVLPKTTDVDTRTHLLDLRQRLTKILDPRP